MRVFIQSFVGEQVKLMRPASIHICNGSFSEAEQLATLLEKKGEILVFCCYYSAGTTKSAGILEKLGAYDNVFVARTDPCDALEKPTFICTKNRIDVEAR